MSETSKRVLATHASGHLHPNENDVTALAREVEALEAEVAVLNGVACKDEQTAGNGPCGVCTDCFRERVRVLEEALRLVVYVDRDLYRTEAQRKIIARRALEGGK